MQNKIYNKMQGTGGSDPGAAAAACVCEIKLTPRKRPCFPYLMTTERVSPWSQAALYVCFVCACAVFIVCLGCGATHKCLL